MNGQANLCAEQRARVDLPARADRSKPMRDGARPNRTRQIFREEAVGVACCQVEVSSECGGLLERRSGGLAIRRQSLDGTSSAWAT